MPINTPSSFRPEIQGLRAIAVLAVLVFHIFPTTLTGGYVGVDVFFVISGYLMTGILFREFSQNGSILLKNFYARRIRRLLPASTLVIVFVAATIFFIPKALWENTAIEIFTSSLYVQNWWLVAQKMNYMAADSASTALQHYWSLSIEEQYYIFWPILFVAIIAILRFLRLHNKMTRLMTYLKARPQLVFGTVIFIIFLLSLLFSIFFTLNNPERGYYITISRIWELALGGLLVVFQQNLRLTNFAKAVLGWLGVGMIIYGCVVFSSATFFPGYVALTPALGTVLVILAGDAPFAWGSKRLLSLRPLQYLGDISYSLYLWHWPLIVIYGYALQKTATRGVLDGLAIFAVALILSHFTKKYVEDTFRKKRTSKSGFMPAFAILAASFAIAFLALSFVLFANSRQQAESFMLSDEVLTMLWNQPYNPAMPLMPSLKNAKQDYAKLYDLKLDPVNKPGVRRYVAGNVDNPSYEIVMVGDSKMGQWIPAVEKLLGEHPDWKLTVYTKSGCAFVNIPTDYGPGRTGTKYCMPWREAVLEELQAAKPDLIITSGTRLIQTGTADRPKGELNKEAVAAAYLDTWNKLTAAGAQVLVILDTPMFPFNMVECLSDPNQSWQACIVPKAGLVNAVDPAVLAMGMNDNPSVYFIDFTDDICEDEVCVPIKGQTLLWRDSGHLTATFVRQLAPKFNEIIMRLLANPQTNSQ